ncbi:hypothetical protein VIAG107301_07965 [Vibrio agarivorans]
MGDFGAMNLSWEIEGEFAGYFLEYRIQSSEVVAI